MEMRTPEFQPETPPPAKGGFAPTQWSLVLEASAEGGLALDQLCRAYWRPVYVFVRASGLPPAEAEDATQEFFADILKRDVLKLADRERGRFRGFLCQSVRLFLSNRRRVAGAQKRLQSEQVVPLDPQDCERDLAQHTGDGPLDPAALYDASWAKCVVRGALDRLAVEQARVLGSDHFERLRPFVMCPPASGEYVRLSETLGIPAGHIAVRVHRLTQRFGDLVRAEIAATLADRRDVESELRYLLQLAARQL